MKTKMKMKMKILAMICMLLTIKKKNKNLPDPSIFTVLTCPSDTPGEAAADFVIFPPRYACVM